jgi:hypothetical protein
MLGSHWSGELICPSWPKMFLHGDVGWKGGVQEFSECLHGAGRRYSLSRVRPNCVIEMIWEVFSV